MERFYRNILQLDGKFREAGIDAVLCANIPASAKTRPVPQKALRGTDETVPRRFLFCDVSRIIPRQPVRAPSGPGSGIREKVLPRIGVLPGKVYTTGRARPISLIISPNITRCPSLFG